MIQLRVITVTRRNSSEVATVRFQWENEKAIPTRTQGAEWEEIEFCIVQSDKPTIQIGNISGDILVQNSPIKLFVNEPSQFEQFKVGDIIDFVPQRTVELSKKN